MDLFSPYHSAVSGLNPKCTIYAFIWSIDFIVIVLRKGRKEAGIGQYFNNSSESIKMTLTAKVVSALVVDIVVVDVVVVDVDDDVVRRSV